MNSIPRPKHYYTEPLFLDVNGLSTAYRRKGEGRPALFLHGGGLTRMWLPFYERCSRHADFIAPEHPGFGETPRPNWLESFEDLVIHYDEFLTRLGIDQVDLIGYSVGGWIASEFASYYPKRIRSITLITPIGLRLVDNPGPDIFKFNSDELIDTLYDDKVAADQVLPDLDDFEEQVQLHAEMATLAKLIWAPRYNLALEWRLGRLDCPALIVKADNDRLVPKAMCDRFAEVIPNASVVTIAKGSHSLIVEQCDETSDEVMNFITGV